MSEKCRNKNNINKYNKNKRNNSDNPLTSRRTDGGKNDRKLNDNSRWLEDVGKEKRRIRSFILVVDRITFLVLLEWLAQSPLEYSALVALINLDVYQFIIVYSR